MTDPNLPPVAPYRSPNIYQPSVSTGGSNWDGEPSSLPERRYGLSMTYTSNSAGAEDGYGSYQENAHLPSQVDNTITGYRSSSSTQAMQGYSHSGHQDQYGHPYSYPLPSPPVSHSSSYEPEAPIHSLSQPSPPSHHRYGTLNSMPPSNIPLNRLPTDSTLLTPLNDHRPAAIPGGDSEDRDQPTPGSRSTGGSEYDEPRGSYDLHSHPQQQQQVYGYDEYETTADGAAGSYSLGRNRLPRDSTLLTPLNLEHIRYGSSKGL